LIAKAFVGKSVQLTAESKVEPKEIKQKNFTDFDSVFLIKAGDIKQKSWFVFENSHVIPEYVVEFEYVLTSVRILLASLC
jgi:hypothetical protein